jgi:GTP-binding protein
MTSLYQKAYFLLSVAKLSQLPADTGKEVALVGRSNAGKSSVLNCLTKNKGLARVSKTPGRTQLINLFALDKDEERRIADLPGYGFANVPLSVKENWQKLVDGYVMQRKSLQGLILVMDIRHPFRPLDLQLLKFCSHHKLPLHILFNKADKLSRGAGLRVLQMSQSTLTEYDNSVTFQLFSALKKTGMEELHERLDEWYGW